VAVEARRTSRASAGDQVACVAFIVGLCGCTTGLDRAAQLASQKM